MVGPMRWFSSGLLGTWPTSRSFPHWPPWSAEASQCREPSRCEISVASMWRASEGVGSSRHDKAWCYPLVDNVGRLASITRLRNPGNWSLRYLLTASRLSGSFANSSRDAELSCWALVCPALATGRHDRSGRAGRSARRAESRWRPRLYGFRRTPDSTTHPCPGLGHDRVQVLAQDVVAGVVAVVVGVRPGGSELQAGVPGHRGSALDRQVA